MRSPVIFGVLAMLVGCSAVPAPPVKPLEVASGTRVDLVLIKQLNAGEAKEGETVPLLVGSDLIVDGRVAVPKGSMARAVVTWSRSEGTLGGLTNRPARLEMRFVEIQTELGSIPIAANTAGKDDPLAITRENTGKPAIDEARVEDLLKVEANRQLAEKLAEVFDGKSPDLSGQEAQEALKEFAKQLNLDGTDKFMREGKSNLNSVAQTISRLQRGDLSAVSSGDMSLSLNSILELANLAGGLGDRVSRSLKGRTIRAYPGTRFEAFVSRNTQLKPSPNL